MVRLLAAVMVAMALTGQSSPERKPDRTIQVVAERFQFSPSQIVVNEGEVVELLLTSEDTDHGFRLAAAHINTAIPQQGKGELKVTFVAAKKGRYPFECSRACGAGHNLMRGELIVK